MYLQILTSFFLSPLVEPHFYVNPYLFRRKSYSASTSQTKGIMFFSKETFSNKDWISILTVIEAKVVLSIILIALGLQVLIFRRICRSHIQKWIRHLGIPKSLAFKSVNNFCQGNSTTFDERTLNHCQKGDISQN